MIDLIKPVRPVLNHKNYVDSGGVEALTVG